MAFLPGVVQHAAIEEILSVLSQAGITDIRAPEAVPVLRQIGGLTALMTRCLDQELERWSENPRAAPGLAWLRSQMNARLSSMRERLQSLLSRMPVLSSTMPQSHAISGPTLDGQALGTLGPGVYAEKWL